MSVKYREPVFILCFLIIFISVRAIHFGTSFNFSSDQGAFSIKAYELFQKRELTLIGPPTSINLEGRQIFQGSIIYYFQLFFLFLGGFDPEAASFIFSLFCALMIFPLFYGTKKLIGKNEAWFMVIIYTLLPYFVNYTKFLWNPNFQLSLSPLLIYLMGSYKKRPSNYLLFATGILAGILLQFHYQFILVLCAIGIYYYKAAGIKKLLLLIAGYITGFSPILLFELRNNFYNLNTIIFYIQNYRSLSSGGDNFFGNAHYFLTIFFFILIFISSLLRRVLKKQILFALIILLMAISLSRYLPEPASGFGMSEHWSYREEKQVFNIIREQNLQSFSVTNLIYDTKASVQKYLSLKEHLDYNNYSYDNTYLFVIAPTDKNISADPAFEITSIRPFKILRTWEINRFYTLSLLKRD